MIVPAPRSPVSAPLWLLLVLISLAPLCGPGCNSSPEARERMVREHRAYAELRVHRVPPRILRASEESSQERFDVYREAQTRMIKSPFVLSAALRDPEISNLDIVRGEAHPVDFLEQHIEIDWPATEFLRVSFAGPRTDETAAIVNAVVKEYLVEVADSQTESRSKRMQELERAHRELHDKIKSRHAAYKRLAKMIEPNASKAEKQKFLEELNARFRQAAIEARLELLRDSAQLATLVDRESEPEAPDELALELQFGRDTVTAALLARSAVLRILIADAPVPDVAAGTAANESERLKQESAAVDKALAERKAELQSRLAAGPRESRRNLRAEVEASVAMNKNLITELDLELSQHQEAAAAAPGAVFELDELREELSHLQEIDRKLTAEMAWLSIEEKAENRVELYRQASAHQPGATE